MNLHSAVYQNTITLYIVMFVYIHDTCVVMSVHVVLVMLGLK